MEVMEFVVLKVGVYTNISPFNDSNDMEITIIGLITQRNNALIVQNVLSSFKGMHTMKTTFTSDQTVWLKKNVTHFKKTYHFAQLLYLRI